MSFLNKSLIILAVLAAYIAVAVFAVNERTPSDQVCQLSKKEPADGTQNRNGSCVQTVLGEIPDVDHMISTLIRFPVNNDVICANEPFTIKTESFNLLTGFFDDPVNEYYIFPQTLDDNLGQIQGHSHITVQKLLGNDIPDPRIFAFFKGLNDKAIDGILSVLVEKGLPVGNYRACTMVSSFAHQCVLMPVAQRGSQDDCVRFKVVERKNNANKNNCRVN
ncbi:13823_t:CDS:2 [Funneliformis geosporum]|uniref:14873_t:CDS:1 n=1 Tax=Funneliformis geosporum TaxID=1117311 RepID=A0A9W4SK86_9GLOM|nr:13823_t:CDS:2 [Funneliformis geosporum]CAI2171469.1 14873_t:CDS:2 [Funneliformis geosporum]